MASSNLIVVLGTTASGGFMPEYLKSLEQADIPYHIEDISMMPNLNGGGNLGWKVEFFRKTASMFSSYEFMIVSDAWDMMFFCRNKGEVLCRLPKDHVLFAAEKNCYPDAAIAPRIPDRGPWRFMNGGLSGGTPQSFLAWCDAAERHPLYVPSALDQWFTNELLAAEDPLIQIDYRTRLFFCLYGGYPELEFVNGMPVNTMYHTYPCWIHANGKWSTEELLEKYQRSLI
jgi:hypothetical protein